MEKGVALYFPVVLWREYLPAAEISAQHFGDTRTPCMDQERADVCVASLADTEQHRSTSTTTALPDRNSWPGFKAKSASAASSTFCATV